MPDVASTKAALPALQAAGVPAGGIYDHKVKDWHVYVHWEHILGHKAVAPDGLPWTGVKKSELPKYSKDMCPQCIHYLARAIMIDTHWEYSNADCKAIAAGINKVVRTAIAP